MLRYIILTIVALAMTFLPFEQSFATHAAGSDLQYECLGNGQYRFTFNFYRDCEGVSAPTSPDLDISSSCFNQSLTLSKDTVFEVSQTCPTAVSACNGGNFPGIENHVYSGTVTLDTTCSDYSANVSISNRNDAVDNLDFSGGNPELFVDISFDPTICSSSPFFTTNPIPYICTGSEFNYNHGAVDPDGDSLVYSLVNPLNTNGNPIPYVSPYSPTYPLATQSGNFQFNNTTGQMVFTPTMAMTAVVTVRVDEYRDGQLIGSIKRDMQFQILNCPNNQPTVVDSLFDLQGGQLTGSNRIEVCPGDSLSFDIEAFDPDTGQSITMTSNVDVSIPNATFDTTGSGSDTITGTFSWAPQGVDTSANVFTVTVKDDGCPIFNQQVIAYNIFVLDGTFANPSESAYCPAGGPIEVNVIGGDQFSWTPDTGIVSASSDSSTIQVAPSAPTTYYVESDLSASCKKRDTIFVDRVPDFLETVDPTPADTICQGQTSQLDVIISPADTVWEPYSYQWTPSGSLNNDTIGNPIASPEEDTKYIVDVTSDTGCTIQDSVNVVVQGQAPFVDIQAPSGLCENDTSTLNALTCQGEALLDDFDPGIDNSAWATLTNVTANGNCGSVSGSNALWFDGDGVREAITVDLNTSGGGTFDFSIKVGTGSSPCEDAETGEGMELAYSTNGGTSWTPIDTFLTTNYSSFTSIQANLPSGAQTPSTRFRFQQLDNSGLGFDNWAIDDVFYQCCGQTCGNYTYNWTPSNGLSSDTVAKPDFYADTSRTYIVEVTPTGTNCTTYDTITVDVSPDFSYTVSDDDTICSGQTTQLNVQGDTAAQPFTYNWQPSSSLNDSATASPIASPTQTTTYNVSITSQGGCTNRDSVRVNVSGQAPETTIQGNSTICEGDSNQLNVEVCSGAALFDDFEPGTDTSQWATINGATASTNCGAVSGNNALWFDGDNTREAITKPLNTSGGGNIEFHIKEGAGASNCEEPDPGESMVLEYANLPGLWNPIDTFQTGNYTSFTFISRAIPSVAQTSTTQFRFRQIGNFAGTGFDNWAIDDVFYQCCGSQCGNFSYNWTPGTGVSDSTIRNPTFYPDSTTTYVVGVTPQGTNCTKFDTVTLNVAPDFNYTVGPDDTICKFSNTDLFAEGLDSTQAPYSYTWSPYGGLQDSAMVNDQMPTAEPDTTTTYTVQIESDSGCINTAQQTVNISGVAPKVQIQSDKNNVCPGDTVNLDANIFQLPCGASVNGCQTTPQIQQYGSSSSQGQGTPFNGANEDTRYQMLLTPNQLNNAGITAGTIVQLFLDVNTQGSNSQYENFTIKMGCTKQDALTPNNGWVTGLTTVFTPKAVSTNSGFANQFTLDTPYDWDGTSNLVVEICYDNPAGNPPGGNDLLNTNAVNYRATMVNSDDDASGCSLSAGSALNYQEIPNFRFRICDPPTTNYTYNWTPTSGLVDQDSLQTDAIIDSTITYELFVDDGQCTNTSEITVNIDTSYGVQASPDTIICTDGADSVKLNATVTGNPPSSTLPCGANGTSCTTTPSTTQIGQGINQTNGDETPYKSFWDDNRVQYLVTASELQAQGLSSGTITELAWNVVQKNSPSTFTYEDFTIKMSCTSLNQLPTNQFASTSLTTVYGPTNYSTTAGVNTHPLNNNFDWDGTSNLIIEVCFNNPDNSYVNAGDDEVLTTTTSFNSVLYDEAISSGENGCVDLNSPTASTDRPNFQFTICDAPEVEENFQWMPVSKVSNDTIKDPWGYVDSSSTTDFVVSYTPSGACTKYDSVSVSTQNFQNEVSNDTSICNDSVQLATSGEANAYTWSPDSSLSCSNCPNPVATPDTVTNYQVLLEDTVSGCQDIKTVTVESYQPQEVIFLEENPDTICLGQNYEIGVQDIYNSYQWSTGDTTPLTIINTVGYHAVTVTDENGCQNADSIFIDAYNDPQPQITPQSIGCANGSYPDTLTLMEEYVSYAWSNGDSMNMTVIDSNGTYSVSVVDSNGCTGSDQMSATIGSIEVDLTAQDTVVIQGESTTLNANATSGNPPYTYAWDNDNPDEVVTGQTGSSIQVTPQSPTTYEVTATDADSCIATDTVFVDVEDEPGVVVPEAFSPNDDGRNDMLMPLTKGPVEIEEFKIFNRWGEELFSMQGQSGQGWDGKYNGNKQPVGTYVYYLIYRQDGEEKKESGSISLVR